MIPLLSLVYGENMNIDLDRVKQGADLLAICERDTQVKKVANTAGGEFAGACPFCGGHDRFHVQPHAKPFPTWMCRQCGGGQWDTVIGYIARRDNLNPRNKNDLAEICRRAVGEIPTTCTYNRPAQPPDPAYEPPADDWQELAKKIIATCKANLWGESGNKALQYLKRRGLSDITIKNFYLGYSIGFKLANLWVPRGVLIPCVVAGEIWYLKIRLPAKQGEQKYTLVTGSRPKAIYNADTLVGKYMALFCEGEFDCMIATQEFGEIIPTGTLGSATNMPDLATWGSYLLSLSVVLTSYDADDSGSKGAAALAHLVGQRAKLAPLPENIKDINDYFLTGGDLLEWVIGYQTFYCDPFFRSE
jgi:DNA primase